MEVLKMKRIILGILLIASLLFVVGCTSNGYSKYDSIPMSTMTDQELKDAIKSLEIAADKSQTLPRTTLNISYAIMYQNELLLRHAERIDQLIKVK
jgi:hypothetical protein